jgi:hypothetical protein
MTIPYIVDVFTKKKYAGNQLAVFFDVDIYRRCKMQEITREINLPRVLLLRLDIERVKQLLEYLLRHMKCICRAPIIEHLGNLK